MSQAKPAHPETGPEQLAYTKPEPQREHKWLQRLVGDWTFESEMPPADGPASKVTGTERVRSLGGLWILAEGEGQMPGPEQTLMTIGYDPATKRFVGSWVGSMMTHFWTYDGSLDASERLLTLESEGPSMSGDGTMAQYRDVIELKSDDQRLLTSSVQTGDGTWQQFNTVTYRRAKARA